MVCTMPFPDAHSAQQNSIANGEGGRNDGHGTQVDTASDAALTFRKIAVPGPFWPPFFPIGALFFQLGFGPPRYSSSELLGFVIFMTLTSLTILSVRPWDHWHRGSR